MRRLLDQQQRRLRDARSAYARDMQKSGDVQRLLRQCLSDLKQEIEGRSAPRYAQNTATAALHTAADYGGRRDPAPVPHGGTESSWALTPLADRGTDLLQSQYRVVSLLSAQCFAAPSGPPGRPATAGPSGATGDSGSLRRSLSANEVKSSSAGLTKGDSARRLAGPSPS